MAIEEAPNMVFRQCLFRDVCLHVKRKLRVNQQGLVKIIASETYRKTFAYCSQREVEKLQNENKRRIRKARQ